MRFIFWLGVCVLAIPAIIGLLAACIAISVVGMASIILTVVIAAVGAILVLPVACWCAYMDPDSWITAKKFVKHGVDSLN